MVIVSAIGKQVRKDVCSDFLMFASYSFFSTCLLFAKGQESGLTSCSSSSEQVELAITDLVIIQQRTQISSSVVPLSLRTSACMRRTLEETSQI